MTKKKKMLFVGLAILAVACVSNIQWSMNDYGYKEISLSKQVMAADEGGLWSKITGTISDWWDDLHTYSSEKTAEKKITRTMTVTYISTGEIKPSVILVGGSVEVSGGSVSGQCIISYTKNQLKYECQKGTDDIFCSDSWKDI